MIRAIAALDDNRGIAAAGHPPHDIPWNIPKDKAYYKHATRNGVVLMGRATFETLDESFPDRRNVVLSSTPLVHSNSVEVITNLDDFMTQKHDDDIWVIGGAALYASALSYCEELYITHVVGDYNCTKFFPEYDSAFKLAWQSEEHEQYGFRFRFAVYKKPTNLV